MKTLVLITSQFPFGTGESFIESELPVLSENFEKTIIIAQNSSALKTRYIPDNIVVYRYNPATSLMGFLYLPVLLILNWSTISKLVNEEVVFRRTISYSLTLSNLLTLLKKIIKSLQLRDFIKKMLKKEAAGIVFYSYWLKTSAHAIAMLDLKNCIKISRAHGSDIYEEKTLSGYLPLLKFSALKLDAIFFISANGKEYFAKKTCSDNKNLLVSYLGVRKLHTESPEKIIRDKFVIVSCSNIVALKRIDLIIYALEDIRSGKEIEWLHFGDGILKKDMVALAETRLHSLKGINFKFMGQYPNEELLKYYSRNQINLFINVSSTEGVPVSIMEAQSFGIPVIATDTGGVKELVREGTGTLLPIDFNPKDLARLIEYYINLSDEDTDTIRKKSIRNIEMNFNATANYNDFINKVNSIFAAAK
jgi:glycosyltransferase involved in cell wall biosynthesis